MAVVLQIVNLVTVLLIVLPHVFAYVPAYPTNSTQEAIAGGLNVTDISTLLIKWYPSGTYQQNISYQLAGLGSNGVSKGALVHFSAVNATNLTPPTKTPWIAMIPCDFNATHPSAEDVFTLARDKGARAAILYSMYSKACVISPEYYAAHTSSDQVLDIFSPQSLTSAHLIEYQFGQSGPADGWYDSKRLNDSALVISQVVEQEHPVAPGFLFAILQGHSSGVQINNTANNGPSPTANSSNDKFPNTVLAMIILSVISGCVSALFPGTTACNIV